MEIPSFVDIIAEHMGEIAVTAVFASCKEVYASTGDEERARIKRQFFKIFRYGLAGIYDEVNKEAYVRNYESSVNGLRADLSAAIKKTISSSRDLFVKGVLAFALGGSGL